MVLHRLYERAPWRRPRYTRVVRGRADPAPATVQVPDLIAEARLAERSDAGRAPAIVGGAGVSAAFVRPVCTLRWITWSRSLPAGFQAPEKPALAADERAARLRLLAQRLRDPDGLDRDTLAEIDQLTEYEQ